jgi:hypothetical protein
MQDELGRLISRFRPRRGKDMAGDWADYGLDQQKRRDPKTGEITKDSGRWLDEIRPAVSDQRCE